MRYEYREGGIPLDTLQKKVTSLASYQQRLRDVVTGKDYTAAEAALVAPYDETHLAYAQSATDALGRVQHVVLIGIGGSSMGTSAVYEALRQDDTPTLHVLDVLDGGRMARAVALLSKVSLEDFAILIISKSGTTTETLANADVLLAELAKTFGEKVHSRVVAIGNEKTPLHVYAEQKGIRYVAMPEKVGGRFSIFTEVGLVPLLLLRFNAQSFLSGARNAFEQGVEEQSAALWSGALLGEHILQGTRLYALFSEQERFNGFTYWYQQLVAESLGKVTNEGTKVGLAPVCMSPRELHSTAQLYLSGFPGVCTLFVGGNPQGTSYQISETESGALLTLPGSRNYDRLPHAIMKGVHAAYVAEKLPHARLDMEAGTAADVGEAMLNRMLEIMYAAHLLAIDAFNQPHVELYKKETRKILEGGVE